MKEIAPSVNLLVFVYTLPNLNMISRDNPYDLTHVFNFQLRLVTSETFQTIKAKDVPPKKQAAEEEEEIDSESELDDSIEKNTKEEANEKAAG